MNEGQHCVLNFEKRFDAIKDKSIALYGYNAITLDLINYYNYNFICIIDDNEEGKYFNDILVVAFSQAILLDIDCIVVTSIDATEHIYNKIGQVCMSGDIKLLDIYGKDLFALHKNVLIKNIDYPRLKKVCLQDQILKHDVVVFSIDNVVFTLKKIYSIGIYKDIEKALLKKDRGIEHFTEKIAEIKRVNSYDSIESLIGKLVEQEALPEQMQKEIIDQTYEIGSRVFVPRKSILESIKYADSLGKKICLIEDMPDYRMSEIFWARLLKEHSIECIDQIVCSTNYSESKADGLMRRVREKYGDASLLYVGDDTVADLILAQDYDMDIFLIKSPSELFKRVDPMGIGMLENPRICSLFENYLMSVYNDEYRIEDVRQRCNEKKALAGSIANRISFYRNNGGIHANSEITYEPELFDDLDETEPIETYTKLVFPKVKEPVVSVVIPVYNQFGYTYNCLKAVLAHSGGTEYEIIVADDHSTDHVAELEKIVDGITIIHNSENLNFLLNCNNAAKQVRGKYILFLNNDTQVQPGWLRPMVRLLEEDNRVGMVGAKLIYPEGILQEAGGILWKDGSAWNYGHMKNPSDPEFCYVKEADYVSGAAIIIRADLWKQIGGFDTSFVPAYYEDTDLAFEVRKRGYKVLFQPASIVVHFEGVSNGTDTSTGLKKYQVTNQNKFFEKWKAVLEKEHFENGTNVYLAKDRGQKRKQILVVDHYVPNFDKDAGGRCTFMYLKMFLKMGLKVTFIGDNYAKTEPYASILNQMGIEILYGDYYYLHWQEWLKDNARYFDYVYLQRPYISIKYIDLVKEYGKGKIFYFAHDLHHIRMYRDYLISGNEEALKESERWKKMEMELFEKADVGHVVGSYEQKVMQDAFPEKPIRNIPLYIYNDIARRIEKDFSKRKDILFVGGFSHTPNVDAVLWFGKNVFPQIVEKCPDVVWHIVGSNAPDEVKELIGEHVVLEGFLTDEELGEFYRKSRMVVVPLRYGAGVKGKIVEAAYYQIPVVTTSIGGEGLDESVGSFVVEDGAGRMASLIAELYMDYERLGKMSDAGETLIRKYFTTEAAEQVLIADM